ncbi:hypothetical protein SEEPBA42_18611, partial [Salmonella enterica subsp. enterica serovar Paratyphi B str. SARA42]
MRIRWVPDLIANSGVLQVGEGELENTLSGSGSLV